MSLIDFLEGELNALLKETSKKYPTLREVDIYIFLILIFKFKPILEA